LSIDQLIYCFNDRPEELLKGLYDMGFSAPSKIQETALPLLLATPLVSLLTINSYDFDLN